MTLELYSSLYLVTFPFDSIKIAAFEIHVYIIQNLKSPIWEVK